MYWFWKASYGRIQLAVISILMATWCAITLLWGYARVLVGPDGYFLPSYNSWLYPVVVAEGATQHARITTFAVSVGVWLVIASAATWVSGILIARLRPRS